MSTGRLVALWLAVVSMILVQVWWWALAGMSEDVATAWAVTDTAAGAVVGFLTIWSAELP